MMLMGESVGREKTKWFFTGFFNSRYRIKGSVKRCPLWLLGMGGKLGSPKNQVNKRLERVFEMREIFRNE